MDRSAHLLAFGTFGSPSGFRQTFFLGGETLGNKIKTFDLRTDAIKLFPDSVIYSIRKEFVNNSKILSYSIYTFAKEKSSERGGTFIGSSILFENKIASEELSISILNKFHTELIKLNVENDVIKVDHSDRLSVGHSKDFDKLEDQLNEIPDLYDYSNSNKSLVVYCPIKPNILKAYFKKSTDLLNVYDTIYFTDSEDVLNFVHQRGIFPFVEAKGFEPEIQKLYADRQKIIKSFIKELQEEISKLEVDRDSLIAKYKRQIEANEESHFENEKNIEQAKASLLKITSNYSEFSSQIVDFIEQLTSNDKIGSVRGLYVENRNIFLRSIEELKYPAQLKKISQSRIENNFPLQNRHESSNNSQYFIDNYPSRRESKKPASNLFKTLSVFFAILWIITLLYFLWFDAEKAPQLSQKNEIPQAAIDYKAPDTLDGSELNPAPNAELNQRELHFVANRIREGMAVKDVVKIIFANNPADIEKHYQLQIDNYAKKIVELNKNCFVGKDDMACLTSDTLKYIPSYKQ